MYILTDLDPPKKQLKRLDPVTNEVYIELESLKDLVLRKITDTVPLEVKEIHLIKKRSLIYSLFTLILPNKKLVNKVELHYGARLCLRCMLVTNEKNVPQEREYCCEGESAEPGTIVKGVAYNIDNCGHIDDRRNRL